MADDRAEDRPLGEVGDVRGDGPGQRPGQGPEKGEDAAVAGLVPIVVGASHRFSSLAVRDRLYVEEYAQTSFLNALREAGIDQALLLSTCDRVEVQAVHPDPLSACGRITELFARHGGYATAEIEDQLYRLIGDAALRHIFAVASSLESTVIGEPHVLGQLKDSHRAARAAGLVGGELETLMQRAFAVGKRVRTETAIGEGPVSVAAAAIDLGRGVHGDLARSSGLVIGSGEVGALLAEALCSAGLGRLFVTDSRPARAEALARGLHCHVLPIDGLADALERADITLGALGSRTPIVDVAMAKIALKRRRNRPMVFIDTAVPGDIDPLAERLDGVFLYTLDDLERVARNGRIAREAVVDAARRIVDEALQAFQRERAERAAVPALVRLRAHFERVRRGVLADAGGDPERATELLINRLLHEPSVRLRHIAGQNADPQRTEAGPETTAGTAAETAAGRELARIEDLLDRLFGSGDEEHERDP